MAAAGTAGILAGFVVTGDTTMTDTASPRGWYSRGYLPHFDGHDTTQMLTFRLADALPEAVLESWRRELHNDGRVHGAPDAQLRRRIEAYIDAGHGECWLRRPPIATVVESALLHFDGVRHALHAWAIMPNHVHAVLTPHDGVRVDGIMHSWKSYTAQVANRILGREGPFWQREYYDRFIRDAKHYTDAVYYVEQNPVNAGLCPEAADWPFGSARRRTDDDAGRDAGAPGGGWRA